MSIRRTTVISMFNMSFASWIQISKKVITGDSVCINQVNVYLIKIGPPGISYLNTRFRILRHSLINSIMTSTKRTIKCMVFFSSSMYQCLQITEKQNGLVEIITGIVWCSKHIYLFFHSKLQVLKCFITVAEEHFSIFHLLSCIASIV